MCNKPIVENFITALNQQWHPKCFACFVNTLLLFLKKWIHWEQSILQDCHKPFGSSSFFEHEGFPYCETHFHAKRGSLCAYCGKPVSGRCITAMFRKFHPDHFMCTYCQKQLSKGTFKEENDKPYCHSCFSKLFCWSTHRFAFSWICSLQQFQSIKSVKFQLIIFLLLLKWHTFIEYMFHFW